MSMSTVRRERARAPPRAASAAMPCTISSRDARVVADDEAAKAPLGCAARRAAARGWRVHRHAGDLVEGRHDGVDAGLDRGAERRQVDLAQRALGDVDRVVVASGLGGAVGRRSAWRWPACWWRPARSLGLPPKAAHARDGQRRSRGTDPRPRPRPRGPSAGRARCRPWARSVQCTPCAVASTAAARAVRSASAGSNAAASASGTGKMVRKPWITSNENSSGIVQARLLDRDALQLARWRRRPTHRGTSPTRPALDVVFAAALDARPGGRAAGRPTA